MAKELPYFKFFVSEWTDGDVTLEDYNVQGVFINICAYYWSNNCVVSEPKLRKKFKPCEFHIDVLMNSHIIKVSEDGLIEINFLDEQLGERDKLSKQNSINALKRWEEGAQCDGNASASDSQSESDAIKRREEKRRKEKRFDLFWKKYPKRVEKKKTSEKFMKLTIEEIDLIFATLDDFIAHKPFPEYNHPNATTYLNNKRWEDEIPTKEQTARPEIDKLVANVALQVPVEMEALISKGWTKEEVIKISKS